jgi:hypothetical protein
MSFKKVCTATINGKRWTIGFGFPGKTRGVVDDGSADKSKRRIVIHAKHNGRTRSLVECICHELLHARFGDIEEAACTEYGELVAQVYEKLSVHE